MQKELKEVTKNEKIDYIVLELSSLRSVKSAAEDFIARNLPLNILLNNAGVMAIPEFTLSEDSIEMQWATNHLGHFYFTSLLMDVIEKTPGSRVVNVSSSAHKWGSFTEDNVPPTREKYSPWPIYGLSKLSNILFTRELQRRFDALSSDDKPMAFSLHPGVIKTDLGRHLGSFSTGVFSLFSSFLKSIPQGAATSVYCSIHPEASNFPGQYFYDCQVKESTSQGNDLNHAAKLWEISEKIINEKTASFNQQ